MMYLVDYYCDQQEMLMRGDASTLLKSEKSEWIIPDNTNFKRDPAKDPNFYRRMYADPGLHKEYYPDIPIPPDVSECVKNFVSHYVCLGASLGLPRDFRKDPNYELRQSLAPDLHEFYYPLVGTPN